MQLFFEALTYWAVPCWLLAQILSLFAKSTRDIFSLAAMVTYIAAFLLLLAPLINRGDDRLFFMELGIMVVLTVIFAFIRRSRTKDIQVQPTSQDH